MLQRNFQIIEFDAGAHYKVFITVFTLSYCFISKYCSTCDVVDCVDDFRFQPNGDGPNNSRYLDCIQVLNTEYS